MNKMEIVYKCPNCGEIENHHYNYDYSDICSKIIDILCNECGTFFEVKRENGLYWIKKYKDSNLEVAQWLNYVWLLNHDIKQYTDEELYYINEIKL